jgi:pilus assembly protein Flp/PilA
MKQLLQRFMFDESGATAIEYGLLAALVAVGAIVGMIAAGGSLQSVFGYTSVKATTVWNNSMS